MAAAIEARSPITRYGVTPLATRACKFGKPRTQRQKLERILRKNTGMHSWTEAPKTKSAATRSIRPILYRGAPLSSGEAVPSRASTAPLPAAA